jgi:hypothetical protein
MKMEQADIAIFHECSAGSIAETINFPTVVGKLMGVGAESYHCDLYRREKIYYLPTGESHIEPEPELDAREFRGANIAEEFSAPDIKAALGKVQTGAITYVEFLRRIMKAGCVAYTVHIAGRRALYLGRKGDFLVENFPDEPVRP